MRKNEKLFQAFGEIDDKFIAEADPRVKKTGNLFVRIAALAASVALIFGALVYLFVPLSTGSTVLAAYAGSEYYEVIRSVETLKLQSKTTYKNRFEKLVDLFGKAMDKVDFDAQGGSNAPTADDVIMESNPNGDENYNETTDNQVAGVIEADIFKRSNTHIFYLSSSNLRAYSIEGEDSELVGSLTLSRPSEFSFLLNEPEMYLSADGETVIVIYSFVNKDKKSEICVRTVDVSNPAEMKEMSEIVYRGRYITSRLAEGRLLLVSSFAPEGPIDYDEPQSFVPSYRTESGETLVAGKDVVIPQHVVSNCYTVVSTINASDGSHIDSEAFFSYSSVVYVSSDSVYLTSPYASETEVSRIDYIGDELSPEAVYTVRGSVLDQYSMDEYNGVIRIVTTTASSADLYCFDKETGELVGSVLGFAPQGEEVTAVRFDGEECYVCTAVRVTFTDPVFFFDLSDPSNITYTDTGFIDGFSTSLINYKDGLALGIGRDGLDTVKIELYAEVDGAVISLSSYTFAGNYSEEYKSYLVNRELSLFGLAVETYEGGHRTLRYLLFSVEDGVLTTILSVPIDSEPRCVRAVVIGDYVYILGHLDFTVKSLTN